jgi:hypothetical protein
MIDEREYPAVCHVCGKKFIYRALFLSIGSSKLYVEEGKQVRRAILSCGNHTQEEVQQSWHAGARVPEKEVNGEGV